MIPSPFLTLFVTVLSVCFPIFSGLCHAQPILMFGSHNATVEVEETLTLTCNFSEPIGDDYYVHWKHGHVPLFRCGNISCNSFTKDSSITLDKEGLSYQLRITNITCADGGFYECGYEEVTELLKYYRLHAVGVQVFLSLSSNKQCLSVPEDAHEKDQTSASDVTTETIPVEYKTGGENVLSSQGNFKKASLLHDPPPPPLKNHGYATARNLQKSSELLLQIAVTYITQDVLENAVAVVFLP